MRPLLCSPTALAMRRCRLAPALLAVLLVGTASAQDTSHRMVLTLAAPGATINRDLFGHFAEHLGRGVYGGIWRQTEAGTLPPKSIVVLELQ